MENKIAMSDEGSKRQKTESSDSSADVGDFFQSLRLRRLIQNDIGFDRLLLAYNWVFLPCFSIILWTLFLVIR